MKAETLRKSILQYAIQGKLVPQIGTEEPASILLEKIKKEKQELIKQGKIKKEKPLAPITDEEKPFDIPDNWEWVRLIDVAIIFTGNSINALEKKKKYSELMDGYNYIATKDVNFNSTINYENGIKIPFETTLKIAQANSTLLCIEGGSAGRKIGSLNQDVCFGNKLCCFEPLKINHKYLFYYLQSPLFVENFQDNTSGIIGGVGINTVKTLFFQLPPLKEQQRIVSHVEELMLLVDEYEKKEMELAKLEKEFPEKLKKSILQYAIQGKLVTQIESDENASTLLKKIKSEKNELVKLGEIKISKQFPPITDVEKPFGIPNNWEFTRLLYVLKKLPANGYSPKGVDFNTNLKVLTLSATTKGTLDLDKYKYFSSEISKDSHLYLKTGDILVQRSNSLEYVGVPCLCDQNMTGFIYPDLMMKLQCVSSVDVKYIFYVLSSDYIRNYFRAKAGGTSDTMKKITQPIVANSIIPLPPLTEQKRIVTSIEELFELVNVLANYKKLPKSQQIKQPVVNIIEWPLKPVQQPKVDVSSFGLVAREDGEVSQFDINGVLDEVQDFYDNKKN